MLRLLHYGRKQYELMCKEIKITKHHTGDITLNLTFEADVKNEHAKEVRRILGLIQNFFLVLRLN